MLSGSKLSTAENYAIGAITGFSEVCITHPLFVIKTKRQQGRPVPIRISALYKGFTANALGFVPITALQIGTAQWLDNHFFANTPSVTQQITSAFTAGAISSFLCCPVEMVMTLQNDKPGSTLTQTIKNQVHTHGISGFFIGQMATALREGCFTVFFLSLTPLLKQYIKPHCTNDTTASLLAGIGSGMGAAIISQPIDTIKTIQQSANRLDLSFFHTTKHLTQAHLFTGLFSRSSSIIISITLMSWMREQLENYCIQRNDTSAKLHT